MDQRTLLLAHGLALAWLLGLASCCYDSGDFSIRSPADFPLASSGDQIEIFFLRAPLEESKLHSSLLSAASLFHSGAGFRSSNGTMWCHPRSADD